MDDDFLPPGQHVPPPPPKKVDLSQLRPVSENVAVSCLRPPEKICFDETELNDQQRCALDRIARGENVFITGGSGTGKSDMIGAIVRKLRSLGDKVAVTSANLNGAISIGGQTIQSFCGLKKLDDTWENIKKEVQLKYIQNIWNSINVLIIDDISMLSPYDFRKILYVSQNARTNKTPIQWVLLGDFLSLPPGGIKPYQEKEKDEMEFCFQLPEWSKLIHSTVALEEDKRHREDKEFGSILENIRMGASNQVKWVAKFQDRLDKPFDPSTPSTKLYAKNDFVNAENEQNLKKLKGEEYKFYAQKGYQIGNEVCPLHVPKSRQHLDKEVLKVVEKLSINEHKRTRLLNFLQKHSIVESTLVLKTGAVVILMANLNYKYGLVKGAQGVITGFVYTDKNVPRYPIVRFDQCECVVRSYMWTVDYTEGTKMWYAQIPLKLGWAYSLHRMRGMTFGRIEVNMKDMFDYGQVYDVLSKVKTLSGINFTNISWSAIKAHPQCVEFYDTNQQEWKDWFEKWKKQGKKCDIVGFSVAEHIPKAAFHMDPLSGINDRARSKPQQPQPNQSNMEVEPNESEEDYGHGHEHSHSHSEESDDDQAQESPRKRKGMVDDEDDLENASDASPKRRKHKVSEASESEEDNDGDGNDIE